MCTSPGVTCACCQVWTTAPSDCRTRFTSTSSGDEPAARYEKRIPRRDPRYQRAAEVAVSSEGEPGAGDSWACVSGGGGGRIRTGLLGADWTPPDASAS